MEERSFETIHDDYAFFLSHSDEPARCRDAMVRELRTWNPPPCVRLLDFGCSRGEFLSGLLREWGFPSERLEVTAVDIDASALPAAAAAIEPFAAKVSTGTSLTGHPHRFDVVLSNHVLYYVPDLESVLHQLRDRLAPGGRMMLLLGGRGNALCGFWDVAYRGTDVPWNRAEDVELALDRVEPAFVRTEVSSRLEFPDTNENRLRILRFLFSDSLCRFDLGALLAHFDQYRVGDRLVIENRDVLFTVSAGED